MFILAQERALSEGKEHLSVEILRTTAKEDLQMVKPMIKALRNNNMAEIIQYDDISINLDSVAVNYKKDIELEGKLKDLFSERKNTIELKRRNTVENIVMDIASIGIFDELDNVEIKKAVEKIVESLAVDEEYNVIKTKAIKTTMELNEKKKFSKEKKENSSVNRSKEGVLALYERAIKNKEHPYDVLKRNGYIKNPVDKFLKVK